VVEWLDANSGITWKYQLLHFPESKEIEMVSDHFHRVGKAAGAQMKRALFVTVRHQEPENVLETLPV